MDNDEIVRVNAPFERMGSKYDVEQISVTVKFYNGMLSGIITNTLVEMCNHPTT